MHRKSKAGMVELRFGVLKLVLASLMLVEDLASMEYLSFKTLSMWSSGIGSAWDGTGCELDSWLQVVLDIHISHVH